MKLFKIIILSISSLILISFIIFYLTTNFKKEVNPTSNQKDFYSKLDLALSTAELKPSQFQIRDYENQVEFYLDQTKIILSTQKDPTWQISSLQEVLKTAKINKIKLIDLSIDHPYATFKNN